MAFSRYAALSGRDSKNGTLLFAKPAMRAQPMAGQLGEIVVRLAAPTHGIAVAEHDEVAFAVERQFVCAADLLLVEHQIDAVEPGRANAIMAAATPVFADDPDERTERAVVAHERDRRSGRSPAPSRRRIARFSTSSR